MHRTTAAGRAVAVLLETLGGDDGDRFWAEGRCSNCDGALPAGSGPQTFCAATCREAASQIRDLRRRRAAGEDLAAAVRTLPEDARRRVTSPIPLRGCDAEDWTTFVAWFQDAEDR